MSARTFANARHLIALHRSEEALAELARDFDSEDPDYWWLRGLALFGVDRTDEAIAAVSSGLRIAPESPVLLDLLACCYSSLGELVKAEQAVLAALRADAEDAELLALYALIVAKAGQIDKAHKLVAEARRIDPENATALRIEAAIAASRGDDRETLLRSRELLALDPESAHAHLIVGEVLHDQGDVDGAAEHLRTAVVNDPRDSIAAQIARENLAWRHPLMWPLRPVQRFGAAKVWIAAIVVLMGARATKSEPVMITATIAWLAYCVYSWIVPPLVRRRVR